MRPLAKSAPHIGHAGLRAHTHPGEEAGEDGQELELPVNPDQGTPLIPDEDGKVTIPA